jgi:hypothetical protein
MENRFIQYRIIEGKKRIVIINENGTIINRDPSKDELKCLKGIPREFYKIRRVGQSYTDKELLDYLIQFYEKYGRPPTKEDFTDNSGYPSFKTYQRHFKSWSNALKLVGLDVDSMVKKGVLETKQQIGRFGEILIRDHFDNPSIDLAGKNCNSPCDGICPNDKNYDVKSSGLRDDVRYIFGINNKHKDEIEIYYLLGFNKDYTKLDYGWRIPGEIVEKDLFYVGLNERSRTKFTVYNMEEYDITEKLREILDKYGYFEKIRNYRKARDKGMTIYEYDKQLYDGCIITE